MGFLQYLHFPFKNIKLKRGSKSSQFKIWSQLGQYDLENKKLSFLESRQITQFKKEPTINPKIKTKIERKIFIFKNSKIF